MLLSLVAMINQLTAPICLSDFLGLASWDWLGLMMQGKVARTQPTSPCLPLLQYEMKWPCSYALMMVNCVVWARAGEEREELSYKPQVKPGLSIWMMLQKPIQVFEVKWTGTSGALCQCSWSVRIQFQCDAETSFCELSSILMAQCDAATPGFSFQT